MNKFMVLQQLRLQLSLPILCLLNQAVADCLFHVTHLLLRLRPFCVFLHSSFFLLPMKKLKKKFMDLLLMARPLIYSNLMIHPIPDADVFHAQNKQIHFVLKIDNILLEGKKVLPKRNQSILNTVFGNIISLVFLDMIF